MSWRNQRTNYSDYTKCAVTKHQLGVQRREVILIILCTNLQRPKDQGAGQSGPDSQRNLPITNPTNFVEWWFDVVLLG